LVKYKIKRYFRWRGLAALQARASGVPAHRIAKFVIGNEVKQSRKGW
jgi:hypothetical protein